MNPDLTYRTSTFYRGIALAGPAGVLLLAVLELTDGGPLFHWTHLDLVALGFVVIAGGSHSLWARIHLTDDTIRKARLLWSDQVVRFDEIQRFYLPMVMVDSGVKIYTASDTDPALVISAQTFERFDDLIRQIVRRLSDEAEVQDPADRLARADGPAEKDS